MTAVMEPCTTGSLLLLLPAAVYVEYDIVHRSNGAVTACFLGPVRQSGLIAPAALNPLRHWCRTCFPGARCTSPGCNVPAGGDLCEFCLHLDVALDKQMERAS